MDPLVGIWVVAPTGKLTIVTWSLPVLLVWVLQRNRTTGTCLCVCVCVCLKMYFKGPVHTIMEVGKA